MKKAVLFTTFTTFTTIVASLFLVACQPPEPDTPELNFGSEGSSNTSTEPTNDLTGEQVKGLQTSDSYQLETSQQQEGSTMKQLSDFAPIEASTVTINTSKGPITFELYRDEAPLTTINFLTLAKEGFYDGIVFHRVIPDFMAQVGDPKTKDPSLQAEWGTGGPGYTIPDEFAPGLTHNSEGIVSMANAGPNTGGSQFFITYGPTEWLDGKHAIFGKVTSGMDVLQQIEVGDTIESVTFE